MHSDLRRLVELAGSTPDAMALATRVDADLADVEAGTRLLRRLLEQGQDLVVMRDQVRHLYDRSHGLEAVELAAARAELEALRRDVEQSTEARDRRWSALSAVGSWVRDRGSHIVTALATLVLGWLAAWLGLEMPSLLP